jgi:hypothetical protein
MGLLGAYLWVVAILAGVAQLAVQGSMGGLGELLRWALFAPMYLVFYAPAGAVLLVPYRVLVRVTRRPRPTAFAFAGVLTLLLALFAPDSNPMRLGLFGLGAGGFAAIVRLPGEQSYRSGLGSLNPAVRGAVVGLLLSFVWILGSVAAVANSVYRARRGALAEAGALAIAGTLLPGVLLFLDLFRDGVPSVNYLVTGALLAGAALGFVLLGAALWGRRVGEARAS